jgi:hypothetical protein
MLTRRAVFGLFSGLLTICLGCGGDEEDVVTTTDPTLPECDGIVSVSTFMQEHTHGICVPAAALASPPELGVTLASTLTNGHAHDIALAPAQLAALARGDTVTVSSTTVEGHSHAFMMRARPLP